MIKNIGKYYLYRHIRLDKNEVFYIGVGTKRLNAKTYNNEYSRAFMKSERNKHWKNIVANTDYEIEILLESDNRHFIIAKEIEFIKLYGRKDLKTGILVNWTIGGDGISGYKWTEEQKTKIKGNSNACGKRTKDFSDLISKLKKGKPAWNKNIPNPLTTLLKSKITLQFTLNGEFIAEYPSATEAAKTTGVGMKSINKCVNNKRKKAGGFVWKYKNTV